MKKLLLFVIISSIILSCNNNDISTDPIIGEWKLISILVDDKEFYTIDDCNSKGTITYFKNGTLFEAIYSKNIKDECIYSEKNLTWKNAGNSIYAFGNQEIQFEFLNNNDTHKQKSEVYDPVTNQNVTLVTVYSSV